MTADVHGEETADAVPIIQLHGVTRIFPTAEKPALDSVDLTVRRGEFVAVIGPSGSGKSTLLNILGLLDRPSSGTYLLNGQDTSTRSGRQRDLLRRDTLGFIFQSSNMLLEEDALTNAAMGLRVQAVPYRDRVKQAQLTLDELGLSHRRATRAKLLSGGERQRCAIGRAIATDPPLLLADEPTGNLDSTNSARVLEILHGLHRAGKTILVITHDPMVAAAAERRIEIRDGRLIERHVDEPASTPPRHDDAGHPFPVDRPDHRRNEREASRKEVRAAAGRHRWGHQWVSWTDDVVEALSSLTGRPLRSLLLALSFALGVAGLVSATGMSQSASEQINARLLNSETSQLNITYRDSPDLFGPSDGAGVTTSGTGAGGMAGDAAPGDQASSASLADAAQTTLGGLEHVKAAGWSAMSAPSDVSITRFGPWEKEEDPGIALASISAQRAEQAQSAFHPAAARNVLDQMNAGTTRNAVILSADAARSLHLIQAGGIPESLSPGLTVWVQGRSLQVVGIYEPGPGLPLYGKTALVSPQVLRQLPQVETSFAAAVEPGYAQAVQKAVPAALEPGQPGRIVVQTPSDLSVVRVGVAEDLGLYVAVLSGIMLALACLSAATAMYLSVQSRTAEIALRRAIGSGKWLIARIFLTEGVLLGVIGGAVGAFAGVLVTVGLAASQGWVAVLSPWYPLLGLGVGTVTGLLSSVYPAWAASRKNPADAMRS